MILVSVAATAYACSTNEQPSSGASSSGTSASSSSGSTSSGGSSGVDSGSAADAAADVGTPVDSGVFGLMNFFVSSKGGGKGGDFRAAAADVDGLAGADAFCKGLAQAVSPVLGGKTWRAYLGTETVSPRSRIGAGPFYNAQGTMVAASLAILHDDGGKNMLSLANTLDENGKEVPIAAGMNVHDILTGATAAGAASPNNCSNWTSNANDPAATVGHSNRAGGGADPTSWNAAHASRGCTSAAFAATGGRGSIYCFAVP